MKRNNRQIIVPALFAVIAVALIFLTGMAHAGNLEPSANPAPTMHSLDEIYNSIEKNYNRPIWKIWNKPFMDWPENNRFAVSVDYYIPGQGPVWGGMVLDKETGLIWARNARMDVSKPWTVAVDYCRRVTISNRLGWRMPTVEELCSLVDMSVSGTPKLPLGHPFQNVQDSYWTSTTREGDSGDAWSVSMDSGLPYGWNWKGEFRYPWPVRGGNGYATGNW